MAVTVGDIGIVRESGADAYNAASYTGITMDTEVRADGDYAKATSDAGLTCGTGWHLVLYNIALDRTDALTNQRSLRQTRIYQDSSALLGLYGAASNYIRRGTAGEDFGSCNAGTLVNVPSGTDDIQVRIFRDDTSTTALTSTVANRSGMMALALPSSDPKFQVRGAASQSLTASDLGYTTCTIQSSDTMDAGFASSGNEIHCQSTGYYVLMYSIAFDINVNVRSGCVGRVLRDGATYVEGSLSYNYARATGGCNTPTVSQVFLFEATSTDVTLEVQGAASKDQGTVGGTMEGMSFQGWYLGDTVDAIRLGHNTNVALTTTETGQVWSDQDEISTTAFTHTAGSANIDVDEPDDYMFFFQAICDRTTYTENDRENLRIQMSQEASTSQYFYGAATNRGDGGTDASNRFSASAYWMGACSSGDTFTFTHDAIAGTASDEIDATFVGLQGINLSNLFAGAATPVITAFGDSNIVFDGELNVAITGTNMGSSAGKVYISQSSSLGAVGTYVSLSIDSYTSTAAQVDIVGTATAIHDVMQLFSTHYAIVEEPTAGLQSTGFPITVTSSAQAAKNTNATISVDTTYIYVGRIESSGDLSSTAFRFEVNHASAGYIAVTTASSYVRATVSTAFDNNADISEVVASTETNWSFVQNNNAGSHDGTFELSTGLESSQAINAALPFHIISSHVSSGETGLIRITYGGGTTLEVYDSTFTYTVDAIGGPVVLPGHGMLLSSIRNKNVI